MTAEILSIGDELLIGQVVNTNASWLAERLSAIGVTVDRITVVGDDPAGLTRALTAAWDSHELVFATGGLGPTHDDVTRAVITDFFGDRLVRNDDVLGDVTAFVSDRGREMRDVHRDQAMVPSTASVMRNAHGTAPGLHFTREGRQLFVMPGVPYEMHGMVESYILPLLADLGEQARATKTVLTTSIPESTLAERLAGIEHMEPGAGVAYLPSLTGVRVRFTVRAAKREDARAAVLRLEGVLRDRAGEFVYGSGTQTIEAVLGTLLAQGGETVAVAESCTGGRVADRLTDVPGSSAYFLGGVVAYSNESKTAQLGVDPALLAAHGAVSAEVAAAMADGARSRFGASIGVSTTGIAGPGGATPGKPVGLVWIGLATANGTAAFRFLFGEDRGRTKMRAAQMALDIVRRHLMQLPLPPSP